MLFQLFVPGHTLPFGGAMLLDQAVEQAEEYLRKNLKLGYVRVAGPKGRHLYVYPDTEGLRLRKLELLYGDLRQEYMVESAGQWEQADEHSFRRTVFVDEGRSAQSKQVFQVNFTAGLAEVRNTTLTRA